MFFVAEGDFRFYREDALKEASVMDEVCTLNRLGRTEQLVGRENAGVWELLDAPREAATGEPVAPVGAASSTSAGEPVAPAGAGVSASSEAGAAALTMPDVAPDIAAYTSPTKPTAEEMEDVSPELEDLLAYMTAAHINGRGNLVWFGWNASPTGSNNPKRSQSIANGSQLIAITAKGARWLEPRLEVSPACLHDFPLSS